MQSVMCAFVVGARHSQVSGLPSRIVPLVAVVDDESTPLEKNSLLQ
jgi:hypothetical protein